MVSDSLCHTFDHIQHAFCGVLRVQGFYRSGSVPVHALRFLGALFLSLLLVAEFIHWCSLAFVIGFVGLLKTAVVVYRAGDWRGRAPTNVWLRWARWKQLRHSVYISLRTTMSRVALDTHCYCLEVGQAKGWGNIVKRGMRCSEKWESRLL